MAALFPVPLDPSPTIPGSVAVALGLAGLFVLAGWVLASLLGSRVSAGVAVAWAAVWGPRAISLAGLAAWLGFVPALVLTGLGIRWPRQALLLGTLGALAAPALRPRGEGPAGPPVVVGRRAPDLLLVTVDTVRADAGLLEGLRSEAGWTDFSDTIAPAPWTLPSMDSLFSGEPVAVHGGGLPVAGGDADRYTLREPEARSFVELLHTAGYETIALVCNPHLRASLGFSAGFSRWSHSDDSAEPLTLVGELARWQERWTGRVSALRHTRDARLVSEALAEIKRPSDRPRFLWVHLLGPHEYGRDPENPAASSGWPAYLDNVAAARERVEALAQASAGWGMVVASDHGEAFGEGGFRGHGHSLQDAELRVPLAIRPPGALSGQGRVEQVGTVNIGRTLLDLAGLDVAFPGEDLRTVPSEPIFVGGVRRDATAFAIRGLDGHYAASAPGVAGPPAPVDPRATGELRALGYLGE